MCRSYADQFEILLKDKHDISLYLKKQLDLCNEQVFDLNDRLIGLQKLKDTEKENLEKKFQDYQQKSQIEIERLENDNKLLKTRLLGLEEFKSQRQTMEITIDQLKTIILKKEDAYKYALQQMEIALIHFKNRLKKEAMEYLNDLAIEFRHDSKSQISNTIKRVIQENFHLNNQLDYLSNELEKSIKINEKSYQDNQYLTRKISIIEDIENESAKKYFTIENIVRMLNEKLKQNNEEKMNFIDHEMNLPRTTCDKQSSTISINENNQSINIKYLEEENHFLKEIISQTASAIIDVIQSDQTSNIEKRNDMLEQFLSILLTSDHLNKNRLLFEKKSSYNKGIYPGSRLGLHRFIHHSSNSHYSLGDLGIVPSN